MNNITISIHNSQGDTLASRTQEQYVNLVYDKPYAEGDYIELRSEKSGEYLYIQLDDALPPSLVYFSGDSFCLPIPFGEKRVSYSPKSFYGDIHLLKAREVDAKEIIAYRNLAFNPYDCHANNTCFPHASANVETRGESVFAARNAINGNTENHSHGAWPYESWGISRDKNAELTLDFGREVLADKIVLYTRSDFPHDNWWKQATVTFPDKTRMVLEMQKSDKAHVFTFDAKRISSLKLGSLIQDETDPSPFPALTQIEVYGTESF